MTSLGLASMGNYFFELYLFKTTPKMDKNDEFKYMFVTSGTGDKPGILNN